MSKNSEIHIDILILKSEYYYVLKWEILPLIDFPNRRLNFETLSVTDLSVIILKIYMSPIFMTIIMIIS